MLPNFSKIKSSKDVHVHKRHLPHWELENRVYFVTWRLVDSLPKSLMIAMKKQKLAWLSTHPKPWDQQTTREYYKTFNARYHQWLDRHYGSCFLKLPKSRIIIEHALRYFDETRYILDEFVIMPNHIHLLVVPLPPFTLPQITHSWKSFTSTQINKQCHRTGPLWMKECFDHIVRSPTQLLKLRTYIRENPKKAQLPLNHFTLGKGHGIEIRQEG